MEPYKGPNITQVPFKPSKHSIVSLSKGFTNLHTFQLTTKTSSSRERAGQVKKELLDHLSATSRPSKIEVKLLKETTLDCISKVIAAKYMI